MVPIKKFYYSQLNELKTSNKSFVSEQENTSKLVSPHSNIKKVSLLLTDKSEKKKKNLVRQRSILSEMSAIILENQFQE